MIDYEYMALSLANLSSIPVRLYHNEKFIRLFHNSKFKPDPAIVEEANIFKSTASVSYYMTSDFLFYGLFRARNAPVCMVLGPVAQLPINWTTASRILLSIGESPARASELQSYMQTIPNYPLRNFLQILCTFAYFFNGEKLSVGDILKEELELSLPELPEPIPEETEHGTEHNTFELEQTLLSFIEYGRVDKLNELFKEPASGRAGKMAQDTLRQQKNLVIVTATLESRAAIRGGLDIETALSLSDLYIQKAELLSSYEALAQLSVQMSKDFATRVAKIRCNGSGHGISTSVRQYILQHITEKLTAEQIADALNFNRSYLCTRFKEETGISVNHSITMIKLEEAKRLLQFSNKSLQDISEHLNFSSQSYFQNVFKKQVGTTPNEFRKNHSSSTASSMS